MATKHLTDRTVKALAKKPDEVLRRLHNEERKKKPTLGAYKPLGAGDRADVMDTGSPGFGVRVNDRGDVVWMLNIRYPGSAHPSRRQIGRYPELGLADARAKARDWRELVARGIDPNEQANKERMANLAKRANSFAAVAEDFIAGMDPSERKRDEVARDVRREFVTAWGARPVVDVTPLDVLAVVKAAKERGAPYQARNLLGYAKRLFAWAIAQHAYGLERSPCESMRPEIVIGRKLARKRILDDAETRALWQASGTISYPYGPLYRLLLLTGARKSEIAEARWSEVDVAKRVLVIPADRQKSDEAHVIPLCDDALSILQSLRPFEGEGTGDYIFSTTNGRLPVNGFSKAKARLVRGMTAAIGAELPAFVIHDIRRTMRTHLSALPIPQHVAERIIGHAQPGLIQTYDRWSHLDEKREGLRLWETRLRSILNPTEGGDNVVSMWAARS